MTQDGGSVDAPGDRGSGDASIEPTPLIKSGTRIRAVVEQANGHQLTRRLEDTALDDGECWLRVAGDGATRCLPRRTASTGIYYADADCQTPLATWSSFGDSCSDPPLYASDTSSTCPARTSMYRITEELAAGTPLFFEASGECYPANTAAPGRFYRYDETPTDPATFVAFEEVQHDTDGRLRRAVLEGSDGSRVSPRWVDAERGERCSGGEDEGGVRRCFPVGDRNTFVGTDRYYEDNLCETPAAVVGLVNCPADYAWRNLGGDACDLRVSVHPLGEEISDPSELYRTSRLDPDECVSAVPESTLSGSFVRVFYELEPAISPVDLPALPQGPAGASGLTAWREESAGRTVPRGWFDSSRGQQCTVRRTRDGRYRCLPLSASVRTYYLDDACTDEIKLATLRDCAERTIGVEEDDTTCPSSHIVWSLSAIPFDNETQLYTGSAGSCFGIRFSDQTELVEVTNPVPDEQFLETIITAVE